MADVFLARRRGPGGVEKQLVLKRIRPERVRDPRFLELFVREAELSMSLVHKNIVPVFDFGRAEDELFLVMEQVDGFDLGALFHFARAHERTLDSLLVAYIGLEACQGLDYAHRRTDAAGPRAVFHRDVTPGNLLVSRDGEVKLVDFGVAARETDLGEAGKVRGTPAYMAPEQARGETIDGRADVYGLGLVLWEALSGKRARTADDKRQMLALARTGEIPSPPPAAPAALREIIERATAPDRTDRYDSARDMQLALDEYVVATRSENRGSAPPSHRLAEWLHEIAPAIQSTGQLDSATVSARAVVTFLDDGVSAVEHTDFHHDRNETMRSLAETVGETSPSPEPETSKPETRNQKPETRNQKPASRLTTIVVLLGATALAGSTGIYLATRSRARPTTLATQQAGSPDASTPHALLPSDARTPHRRPPSDASARSALRAPRDAATNHAPSIAKRPRPRTMPTPTRRTRADAAPPDVAAGTVRVSSSPWAEVSVLGHSARCKDTPCRLSLPPGTYTLTLRNPVSRVGKTLRVHVKSGETTLVRETLTQRL